MVRRSVLVPLAAALALVAACRGDDDGRAGATTTVVAPAAPAPASIAEASTVAPTTAATEPTTTAAATAPPPSSATTVDALAPAPFTVQPGPLQAAVLGATTGEDLELRDHADRIVGRGTVDAQGSLLFRDVAPGDGYVVRAADSQSPPFAVADPTDHPDVAFHADQPLLPAGGFGYVTVRDGTTLSANVVLPGPPEAGPYPTVVEYSGYDPSNPDNTTFAQLFNALGFAYVGVNMRGSGCSGGSYRFFETIQNLDGYDVVEAVAAQPWVQSNTVGMVGISYPGISQLFVAQTRPPHLSAITPLSVLDDSYRATLHPGGILNTGFAVDWISDRMEETAPFGQAWTRDRADGGDARCADNQALRLQNPDLVAEIEATPFYENPLADSLAPITFVDRIEVPVFLAGAWQDEQTGGHFPRLLDRFTSAPRLDVTLVNGLHTESLSPPIFGRYAEFLQLYVARRVPTMAGANAVAPILSSSLYGVGQTTPYPERFAGSTYEQALATYEAEPTVRVLLEQGAAAGFPAGAPAPLEEVTFASWPVESARAQAWFLGADGVLADATGPDGEATYTADPSALPATFYDGSASDIWQATATYDWQPLPAGTGLGFVTPALDEDVTIMGAGSLDLTIAASGADTDLEVTLSEVRPDGTEIYIQSGWLRASMRALDETASTELEPVPTFAEDDVQPLVPGEAVDVSVPLLPVAHPLRAGSRLRLTVDAPGNNRPVWSFRTISAGEQVTVSYGTSHPSRLMLPVVDGVVHQPAPPACASLRGQPCRPYTPAENGG